MAVQFFLPVIHQMIQLIQFDRPTEFKRITFPTQIFFNLNQ